MHSHHLRNRLALFVIALTLLPGIAFADKLLMQNGDIITGNIIKIVDSTVHI